MTQEEKAKRYDEALERARKLQENSILKKWLWNIFPELKESEDERIRKGIKSILEHYKESGEVVCPYPFVSIDEALVWLEKQGEQKPAKVIDKYEGLTDFERTLADICIGWIGEEIGWKEYIKDNANVLFKIAVEKFNSVQDVPFELKSVWSEEDERILDALITSLNNEVFARRLEMLKGIGVSSVINWLKSIKHS